MILAYFFPNLTYFYYCFFSFLAFVSWEHGCTWTSLAFIAPSASHFPLKDTSSAWGRGGCASCEGLWAGASSASRGPGLCSLRLSSHLVGWELSQKVRGKHYNSKMRFVRQKDQFSLREGYYAICYDSFVEHPLKELSKSLRWFSLSKKV